jgi:ABC-type ATPase involved in cell division
MDIRKISIGTDYKSSAMHYIVGQEILGGSHTIHLIKQDEKKNSIKIWIQKKDEIFLWKEFNSSIPIAIEYNINF